MPYTFHYICSKPHIDGSFIMNYLRGKSWHNNEVLRIIIIFLVSVLLTILVSKLLPTSLPLILPEGKRPGLVAGTNNDMTYIDAREALEEIKKGNGILVDVRDKDDFMRLHPEGAVNIPYHESDNILSGLSEIIPEGKIIYILCEGALCDMSVRVAGQIAELGYRSIIIKQDFGSWEKLKLPAEKGNSY